MLTVMIIKNLLTAAQAWVGPQLYKSQLTGRMNEPFYKIYCIYLPNLIEHFHIFKRFLGDEG